MLGINGGELIVLLFLLAFVVGPTRLPTYAAQLAAFVRAAKLHAVAARTQIEREIGDQGSGIDWATLDPRQYDPRRIVRDALLDPVPSPARPRASVDATTAVPGEPLVLAPQPPHPGDPAVPVETTVELLSDLESAPGEGSRTA